MLGAFLEKKLCVHLTNIPSLKNVNKEILNNAEKT